MDGSTDSKRSGLRLYGSVLGAIVTVVAVLAIVVLVILLTGYPFG